MGWTVKRERSAGHAAWKGVYRDRTGQEQTRSFHSKQFTRANFPLLEGADRDRELAKARKAAERAAAEWFHDREAEMRMGRHVAAESSMTTFGDMFERYMKTRGPRPRGKADNEDTREYYRRRFERDIEPLLGRTKLRDIDERVAIDWIAWMRREGKGDSVVSVARKVASAAMKFAVSEGSASRNPFRNLDVPPYRPARERIALSVDQALALIDEYPDRYKAFAMLLAFSGPRIREALALRVKDLRPDESLRIREQIARVSHRAGTVKFRPPKSGKPRTIWPVPTLVEALRSHISRYTSSLPESLIFTDELGRPIRSDWLRSEVHSPAAMRAGLDRLTDEDGNLHERVPTPHDLRSTALTLGASAGVEAGAVQAMAGHGDLRTTQQYIKEVRDVELRRTALRPVEEHLRKRVAHREGLADGKVVDLAR